MKIVHLSHSDISGGASIAAYRIHKMLLKYGFNSSMWVDQKILKMKRYMVLIQKLKNL